MSRLPHSSLPARVGTAAITLGALIVIALSATTRDTLASSTVMQAKTKTIWDGIYTEAQAVRGRSNFMAHCSSCHSEDLTGGEGPSLIGGNFSRSWGSRYVDRLFRKVRDRMPAGEPETVLDKDKIDIIAFILQQNGFPAGNEELPPDANLLAAIQIVGKNGPEPAANGALIEVVGCLAEDGKTWMLTNGTEPEVSTLDDPAKDARDAVSRPIGTASVRLLDIFPKPDGHKGHKMMAKGLLIRGNNGLEVNVLALEMVAPTCP